MSDVQELMEHSVRLVHDTTNVTTFMFTMLCTDVDRCGTRVRVGRIVTPPNTRIGGLQYCVICGARATYRKEDDEDYWEYLSKELDVPIVALQAIHKVWDSLNDGPFGLFAKGMWDAAKPKSA